MRKIDVVHNKDGWENYDEDSFELSKSILIKFIEDLIKDGLFPQIGSCLCAKTFCGDGCYVMYVKTIWFYEDEICFILDEDFNSIVNG